MTKLIPRAKSGIHIKKENRGKFSAAAKRAGMSTQQYASHVLANPNAPAYLKKRANFARNAAKWKHQFGGTIKYQSVKNFTQYFPFFNKH